MTHTVINIQLVMLGAVIPMNTSTKKFPPMRPSNLITGNQTFEHHSAYLSGAERESLQKQRPASAPKGWMPPNMTTHRYQHTI
eukprot:14309_2